MIDFESDAREQSADVDVLTRLTELAELLLETQRGAALLDEKLAAMEANIRRLSEEDIPQLLRETGLSEVKLANGVKIVVTEELDCSIGGREQVERREAAFDWLAKHQLDGIIKTGVLVPFGRGESDSAEELQRSLVDLGYVPQLERDIHWQTLRSTLKGERARRAELRAALPDPLAPLTPEQQNAIGDIPETLFGIRAFNKAALKLPEGMPKPGKLRKRA